jgi:hypothetical protein
MHLDEELKEMLYFTSLTSDSINKVSTKIKLFEELFFVKEK